jgi:D-psicose/D-tagatose/L-ribulose 3-epimerase
VKFGVNTFVWVSPFTTAAARDLAPKVKALGFDILEVSCETPGLIDVGEVGKVIRDNGLEAIVCGAWGPDRDIANADPKPVKASKDYIRWLIDAAAELGSPTVCGPMYSGVGRPTLMTGGSPLSGRGPWMCREWLWWLPTGRAPALELNALRPT